MDEIGDKERKEIIDLVVGDLANLFSSWEKKGFDSCYLFYSALTTTLAHTMLSAPSESEYKRMLTFAEENARRIAKEVNKEE